MDNTPQVSTLSTLWFSETLEGEKKQVAYVQSIPEIVSAREAITYNALDLLEEQQAKGSRSAEQPSIEVLYTEQQHKTVKELADSDKSYYWFIKYPDSTKDKETGALVMYFTAQIDLTNAAIEINDMLKDTITIYRNSSVKESYGFPTTE